MSASDSVPKVGGREGFTLIEVLVAMVILAVGLLALESMAIGAARQVAVANRTTEYTLIASERLESSLDLARNGGTPVTDSRDLPSGARVDVVVGTAAMGGGTVWNIAVTVTPPASGPIILQPVTLRGSHFR